MNHESNIFPYLYCLYFGTAISITALQRQESPPALTRKRHTDRGIFRMGGGTYSQVWMGGVWPGPAGGRGRGVPWLGGGGTLAGRGEGVPWPGGRGRGTLAGGRGGLSPHFKDNSQTL